MCNNQHKACIVSAISVLITLGKKDYLIQKRNISIIKTPNACHEFLIGI